MRWTEYAVALLLFSVVSMLVLYAMQRLQQVLPLNPQGVRRGRAGPRVQHRRVVHDQHELAGVQRRIDHELLHADGRPRLPQLRVGGGRHRGRHRVHPRHRAEGEGHASATSGSTWSARRSGCCCRSRSSARCSSCRRAWCRTSGRTTRSRSSIRRPSRRPAPTASRRRVVTEQTIAQGPVASQEIIKQFGTNGGGFFNANSAHPFENPTPLDELPGDVRHLRHLGGPHLHARLDDRLARARLGGVGRDGVPLPGRRHGGVLGRSARATRC